MDPQIIIQNYVGDVVRHLPRRQRRDIAFELQSLLTEDLQGRAADSGGAADGQLAIELLTEFGRPQDVADRYRPAGFTIIRPADAPRFAWISLGGLLLQWIVTLPVALLDPNGFGEWPTRLGTWWLSWGLGAFWWPGFIITMTLIAALIAHRRGERTASWAAPHVADRDRIRRPVMVLLTALAVAGASVVVALPNLSYWAPALPQPALDALALDPEFAAWKAPWVLVLWVAELVLVVVVIARGRWDRTTRRLSQIGSLAWIVLITVWVLSGRIFLSPAADETAKLCLVLIAAYIVIDLIISLRRTPSAIREPAI